MGEETRLSLRPISCLSAVCDTDSTAAAVVCGLWCYTSVICLCTAAGSRVGVWHGLWSRWNAGPCLWHTVLLQLEVCGLRHYL